LTREPNFEELVGTETTGAERERLLQAHELLLQAGPPAELPPKLLTAPSMEVDKVEQRRKVKTRGLLLLAATLSVVAVFFLGYGVANHRNNGSRSKNGNLAASISLRGTALAPDAQATLDVWHPNAGNWPMKLEVAGLPKLPRRSYYGVYWVRDGRILASCGQFRVDGPQDVTVSLNAPYPIEKGDSWVVTRQGPREAEPGKLVMRPVKA
jgi:hypothetical protein